MKLRASSTRFATALVASVCLLASWTPGARGDQNLTLEDAVERGLSNFQGLAAREKQARAAAALASNARWQRAPDLTVGVQQTYGTVNGLFGPQLPIGLSAISSAGPTSDEQSWNSAFGANYLLAANWEFFTFGRIPSRIQQAEAQARRASADVEQERFVHGVRIASAYLELLVAQQLSRVAAANLERVNSVKSNVDARAASGLVPEVDARMALADVSRATLEHIDAQDREARFATQLAILLDADTTAFQLDESLLARLPSTSDGAQTLDENPQLKQQRARIEEAERNELAAQRSVYPGINLTAALQGRAGGFDWNYSPDAPERRFSRSYLDGVVPTRVNYIVGLTLAWNVASLLKVKEQVHAQRLVTEAVRSEEQLTRSALENQLRLSDARIANMRKAVEQVPLGFEAANAAYQQRAALYKNGLTTLIDVQQALFMLNRADADRSVAAVNLWRAVLEKAAATGDFGFFLDQANAP